MNFNPGDWVTVNEDVLDIESYDDMELKYISFFGGFQIEDIVDVCGIIYYTNENGFWFLEDELEKSNV